MKLAASNIAWKNIEFKKFYELISMLNCKGVEIAPSKIWKNIPKINKEEKTTFTKEIKKFNLEFLGFHSLLFGRKDLQIFKDRESRNNTKDYLFGLIDLCSELNGQNLVFGSPNNRNTFKNKNTDEIGKIFFNELANYAKKNGVFICIEPLDVSMTDFLTSINETGEFIQNIGNQNLKLHIDTKSFLLSGLKAESEQRDGSGGRIYTARKAAVEGASKINLKGKITLSLDEDDDNLIDEDDLLTGATGGLLAPPSMEARSKSADDCGGRKPCDNCTCGRAEQGVQEEKKEQQKSSSCGNCAKGDAFRCAGCPYLGMPAFKEGEEHLILNLKDDV